MFTKKFAQRTAGFIAVGITALAGVSLAAMPAQAATSNCESGATCLWEDKNYMTNGVGANLVKFQNYIPDLGLWKYSSTTISANDSASSVYNNGNLSSVNLYKDKNAGGWSITFVKKSGSNNLANNSANDAISSGYF